MRAADIINEVYVDDDLRAILDLLYITNVVDDQKVSFSTVLNGTVVPFMGKAMIRRNLNFFTTL